jgi:hypothetical protein
MGSLDEGTRLLHTVTLGENLPPCLPLYTLNSEIAQKVCPSYKGLLFTDRPTLAESNGNVIFLVKDNLRTDPDASKKIEEYANDINNSWAKADVWPVKKTQSPSDVEKYLIESSERVIQTTQMHANINSIAAANRTSGTVYTGDPLCMLHGVRSEITIKVDPAHAPRTVNVHCTESGLTADAIARDSIIIITVNTKYAKKIHQQQQQQVRTDDLKIFYVKPDTTTYNLTANNEFKIGFKIMKHENMKNVHTTNMSTELTIDICGVQRACYKLKLCATGQDKSAKSQPSFTIDAQRVHFTAIDARPCAACVQAAIEKYGIPDPAKSLFDQDATKHTQSQDACPQPLQHQEPPSPTEHWLPRQPVFFETGSVAAQLIAKPHEQCTQNATDSSSAAPSMEMPPEGYTPGPLVTPIVLTTDTRRIPYVKRRKALAAKKPAATADPVTTVGAGITTPASDSEKEKAQEPRKRQTTLLHHAQGTEIAVPVQMPFGTPPLRKTADEAAPQEPTQAENESTRDQERGNAVDAPERSSNTARAPSENRPLGVYHAPENSVSRVRVARLRADLVTNIVPIEGSCTPVDNFYFTSDMKTFFESLFLENLVQAIGVKDTPEKKSKSPKSSSSDTDSSIGSDSSDSEEYRNTRSRSRSYDSNSKSPGSTTDNGSGSTESDDDSGSSLDTEVSETGEYSEGSASFSSSSASSVEKKPNKRKK